MNSVYFNPPFLADFEIGLLHCDLCIAVIDSPLLLSRLICNDIASQNTIFWISLLTYTIYCVISMLLIDSMRASSFHKRAGLFRWPGFDWFRIAHVYGTADLSKKSEVDTEASRGLYASAVRLAVVPQGITMPIG